MNERSRILFANDTFYSAFARGDLSAMEALWSRNGAVCCIHPGWPALTARTSIMQSWASILKSGGTGSLRGSVLDLLLHDGLGIVVCQETLGGNVLVATNAYRLELDGWAMCHHHAGAMRAGAASAAGPPPVPN